MKWGDCEIVYNKDSRKINEKHYKGVLRYMNAYSLSPYENIWYDKEEELYFSAAQAHDVGISGLNHHFISNPRDFILSRNNKLLLEYRNLRSCYEEQREIVSTEIKCGLTENLLKIRNQDSVLIVGGGPSTDLVNFSNLQDLPIWTMNNCYKNKKIDEAKNIQLYSILDDTDVEQKELWNFLYKKEPLLVQEISNPWKQLPSGMFALDEERGPPRHNRIKELYPNSTFVNTRYRSKLGVGARLVIFAILMGIKNIYVVGLDGYDVDGKYKTHSFEEGKGLPNWLQKTGKNVQKQQFVIFWDYILNTLSKSHDFKIHDLAINCETSQYSFITKAAL